MRHFLKVLRTGALAPQGPALSARGQAKGTSITQEGQCAPGPVTLLSPHSKTEKQQANKADENLEGSVGSQEDFTHRQGEPHVKLPVFVI